MKPTALFLVILVSLVACNPPEEPPGARSREDICDPRAEKPCPYGGDCCGSTCVELAVDENNCGACGNQCNPGWACCDGECINYQIPGQEPGKECESCSAIVCHVDQTCCLGDCVGVVYVGAGESCGCGRICVTDDPAGIECCDGICIPDNGSTDAGACEEGEWPSPHP